MPNVCETKRKKRRNMSKNTTGVGVIGLAVVLLTIGGLMTLFQFGDDIIAKLFLIAGTVAAAAGFAGFVLSLVMAPGIARYAIAGIALFALFLGGLWYFYNKTEWGKLVAEAKQETKQVKSEAEREAEKAKSESERLNREIADLRGQPPAIVTITVVSSEIEESTITVLVDQPITISVSEVAVKTMTVKLPAVTVTESVKVASLPESAETNQLRRHIQQLESELRLKDVELGIKNIGSTGEGNESGNNLGKGVPKSAPDSGKPAPVSPPKNAQKPSNNEIAENERQSELSTMSESEKGVIRQIRESVRRKIQSDPNYKPTKLEKRAYRVADLLDSITDSFELVILRVKDGDTFVGAKKSGAAATMTVRLSAINAPEMHEPWGSGAKSFLVNALGGKRGIVRVKPIGFDKYGRLVAVVFRKGIINESIVRQGRARLIERYCEEYNQVSSCDNLIKAQDDARKNTRGIWGERPPLSEGLLNNLFQSET